MTLHILQALKELTILDVVITEKEKKFYAMCAKDMKFTDLCTIKEQLNDVKEMIVYTSEFKNSPNGEQCQMEIIVENKEYLS